MRTARHTRRAPSPPDRPQRDGHLPGQPRNLALTMTAAAALLALSRPALAAPDGATVTSGSVAFSQSGKTTNINQSTDKAIINWRTFSIANNETVNFNQPSASSMTLNRVVGNERSVIEGALNANGKVYLLNSAGVLIGKGASINASGFTASALNITDANFLSGNFQFSGSGSSTGDVINLGTITASEGGHVVLMGRNVSNQGVITATKGTVALASGNKVTLNFNGDSLVSISVDEGVLNALVENKQAIYADGGTVILNAKAADTLLSAQVNNTGLIQARTIGDLKGNIQLYAHNGTTVVDGTLDASAPTGGNGGFIETSGDKVKVADTATITTKAAHGKSGTWLIDPTDFTVAASGGDITGAALGTALDHGSVEIQSSSGSSGSQGNVNINDAVTWSADTTLTLTAVNNVNIGKSITATGTNAGLALNFGGDYSVNTANGAKVTLSGSGATLAMNGNAYALIHDMGELTSTITSASNTGRYAIAKDIDASGTTYSTAVVEALNGTLAGLGHTISGLTISSTADTVALVGTLGATGTIRDLGLANANVSGGNVVGSLVGISSGTLSNIHLTGTTVTGTGEAVGGLAGRTDAGSISNAHAENTTVTGGSTHTGGLVGDLSGTAIADSHVSGTVTGQALVGGLVGNLWGSTVTGSHFSGAVTGTGNSIGGLIGEAYNHTVTNSYSEGTVAAIGSLNKMYVGGLVGFNFGTISNSWSSATVTTINGASVGGLVGRSHEGTLTDVKATGNVSAYFSHSVEDGDIGGLVGTNSGAITRGNAYGDVTAATSSSGITATNGGGFVGRNKDAGSIVDSHAYGTVTGPRASNVYGGFAGWNSVGATIANSSASGNVTAGYGIGGFVGVNNGTITGSSASGNVLGLYTGGGGGFVGENLSFGVIRGARATGNIRSYGYAGALYGTNYGYIDGVATGTAVYLGKYYPDSIWGGPIPKNVGTAIVVLQPASLGNAAAAAGVGQASSALEPPGGDAGGSAAQGKSRDDTRKRSVDSNIQLTGKRGASSGSIGTIRVDGNSVDAGGGQAGTGTKEPPQ